MVTKNILDHALVVRNPAKQTGWVCVCGERLTNGLQCHSCGKNYQRMERGPDGALGVFDYLTLFVQSFIILHVHPHGKQQRLKRADEQKHKRQHGQRRDTVLGKKHNPGDFDYIGN